MSEHTESMSYPKFTKGEKCIFAHLVFTFSLILLTTIVYLIHLFLVDHNVQEVFITRRKIPDKNVYPELDIVPIGQLFINVSPIINICNIMLLTPKCSVGPGHCIAMRSEPDLSHLLLAWRIKYKYGNTDVAIKRSIVHPHFDRDTFANNIGLVQHVTMRGHQKYNMGFFFNRTFNTDMTSNVVVSWNVDTIQHKDENIIIHPVQILNEENCSFFMTPIIEPRSYEFCTTIGNHVNSVLGHGALVVNKKVLQTLGFFTWGEKQERTLPLVILNLTYFQDWLKVIMI